jgi:diphthamide biosynthesis protein 7
MRLIFHVSRVSKIEHILTITRTLIDKTPFPAGILDLHFIPNHQTFAVASSTGTVSFYNFQTSRTQYQDQDQSHDPSHPTFHPIVTHQIFPTAILILSITWILTTTPNPPLLVATLNTGEIYLLYFPSWDFLSYKIMNEGLPLATHSAESWISAVCPTLNHIYTGGDDIKLRIHDINLYELNQHPEIDVSVTETFKPRGHEAGITAVLPLPHLSPRLFLTGSYDDHIRIFSVLLSGQAKVVTSLYLGGGVWRLKFLSPYPLITSPEGAVRYKVLASCMHAGVKILEVSCDEKGEEWEVEEVAWCTEHKSMNYASDVQPLCVERNEVEMGNENEKKKRVCVSTSFYDMLLVVWEFDPSLPPGENS